MIKKAFTLVEMLVALVLISLLIGVAVFAFRLQLITIHKTKTEGLNNVIKYTQVKSLIESMKYYVVNEYNILDMPIKKLHYYVSGNSKHIKFITTNPIYTNTVALVELSCIDDKLLYREEALFKRIDYLRPDFLADSKSEELYKNLKKCSFEYKTLKATKIEVLNNEMPTGVSINLEIGLKKEIIYSSVKSDDNTTLAMIYDMEYQDE